MTTAEIGAALRAARTEKGWSIGELSRRSGVPRFSISRWERGYSAAPLEASLKIDAVLSGWLDSIRYVRVDSEAA